jgi:fatty-acyl-CoA synthase
MVQDEFILQAPSQTGTAPDVTFNYLTTLRCIAGGDPRRPLVASPRRRLNAAELVDEVDRLAAWLAAHGAGPGAPVGLMLWNRAEFVVGFYAALAVGAPPVNVNPRYQAAEAAVILRDCDASAVLCEGTLPDDEAAALRSLGIATLDIEHDWLDALACGTAPVREPSVDDVLINYTGGTTGRPKGVVWNIDDHYRMLWEIMRPGTDPPSPAEVAAGTQKAPTAMPLSPLAHATAQGLALNTWNGGGKVVISDSASFDPAATLDLVDQEHVAVLGIVGDIFARPLLAELDAHPRVLGSLRVISSSGAAWSQPVRTRLKEHLPDVRLIDNYGSTEALITRNSGDGSTFEVRPGVTVLDRNLRPMRPGTGEVGRIATSGRLPLGYLNAPAKTAETFPVIGGVRYLVVGDDAILEADGTIRMLGRGNACINSGGEKVWPEEVEAVLLTHGSVRDAAVVGEPSERWGEQVVAVVAIDPASPLADADLRMHAQRHLSGYKVPKRFVRVESVPRTFAGKPDYPRLHDIVVADTVAST